MPQHPATSPAPAPDAYHLGLDIRHTAACQDGTADTAIDACLRIETLCDELLRVLRG